MPDRKNWNKPSGPIIRLTNQDMRTQILLIITNHFKEFEERREPVPSELELLSAEAKATFFRQHRFICVEQKRDNLSMLSSKVINNSPFQIEFGSPGEGICLHPPWSTDQLVESIDRALDKSENLSHPR